MKIVVLFSRYLFYDNTDRGAVNQYQLKKVQSRFPVKPVRVIQSQRIPESHSIEAYGLVTILLQEFKNTVVSQNANQPFAVFVLDTDSGNNIIEILEIER